MIRIKLADKFYEIIDSNTIPESLESYNLILFKLEFNFLGECKFKNQKHYIFKHSSNNYYLLFNQIDDLIIISLFFRYKKETFLMRKCKFNIEDFTIDNVYHKLIFPYVLQYHMFKEHYKRLHLKIIDRTVRRILECRFMKDIVEYISSLLNNDDVIEVNSLEKNTIKNVENFNYFVLLDRYNPFINHIEYNYTEQDYSNMDEWKSYYD